MDFDALTFVDTPDFQCWMPSMKTIPASKMLAVMRAGDMQDTTQQLELMMGLVRENLAPDLLGAFEALTIEQTVAVIGEWVAASGR